MSINADIETVKTYVSRLDEDIELVADGEIEQAIKRYCTRPVAQEASATLADMLSELCTLSLQRRCERTAEYFKGFYSEELDTADVKYVVKAVPSWSYESFTEDAPSIGCSTGWLKCSCGEENLLPKGEAQHGDVVICPSCGARYKAVWVGMTIQRIEE